MENNRRTETFIGFAVKAGKFRSGQNTLATLKKAYLILVCETAAENTKATALKYAAKYRCPVYRTDRITLSEIAHKDGIKIAAITDLSLAKAIIDSAEQCLIEISSVLR